MAGSSKSAQKAVALKYDPQHSSAPVVVASGAGEIAKKIIDLANDNQIPVYHDDSAATLLSQLELGQEIPPDLFKIVVEIYVAILQTAQNVKNEQLRQIAETKNNIPQQKIKTQAHQAAEEIPYTPAVNASLRDDISNAFLRYTNQDAQ